MAEPVFDRKEQFEQIKNALLPGEAVEGVFDLKGTGTGFIGVTSGRVIVYDKAFLQKMKAVVSVPYSRIHALGAEDEGDWIKGRGFFASSKLILHTSHGHYELEFRGADKAHQAHDMILAHMM